MTGAQIATLDDAALCDAVRVVNVYARTPPDQKLRLVRALQTNGDIVAMTGDGVNDAPALKAAHIGIAMGRRGADVAREAAALVLLSDDFSALVAGVGVGRRIYENIRNAMSYLLAVHIPLAGMGLLPLLLGWPLLLFPLHVVFLEFVIDPACTLVFETEQRGTEVMRRPPRDPVSGCSPGQWFSKAPRSVSPVSSPHCSSTAPPCGSCPPMMRPGHSVSWRWSRATSR